MERPLPPHGAAWELRFNERCSYGLEDFVFNAAAYRRVGKAVYIPQVVYRHFESAQEHLLCAHGAGTFGPHPGAGAMDGG